MIELEKYPTKRYTVFLLMIMLSILIAGCSIPNMSLGQGNRPFVKPISLVASGYYATPTATPFLPLDPTPTFVPTELPTFVPSPIPTNELVPDDEPVPDEEPVPVKEKEPVEAQVQTGKQIKVLVLGSDQRQGEVGFRTDTIILLNFDIDKKKVSMVSFPRDLYVQIPGYSYQRINTAMFYGGFDTLAQTLKQNFGVNPTYYVLVNFQAFEKIIDTLGGIDVEVGQDFSDRYKSNSNKKIPAGMVHMDSTMALWYARSRETSNDFDRARRQQEVLHAIGKKLVKVETVEHAKDLYKIMSKNITTNLTWQDIKPFIPLMFQIRETTQVHRYVIGPGQVYDWITPGGAMVLIPRPDQINILIKEALGN